ncbi:MAG TPA: RsmD family RNA methyltransferase [Lacisediminihabitans sp.]|uniref:RsmD family RNA methyltransferase n=1 Tax=Lacisediminihabitans sp. TaxID=2787631 RepID=UPI002ED79795
MTRIIAGFAGSITLATPGSGTRPTSDRVREAIFSALEARDAVAGARVLDLYAGTGALGLEAASRGAAVVRLVERGTAAVAACRRNAAAVERQAPKGAVPRIEVSAQPVLTFLVSGATNAVEGGGSWDLVFMDPPYELDEAELARDLEALVPRLAPDALLVLERSSRSPEPVWPPGLEPDRRKDYGDTTLWWVGAAAGAQPADGAQPAAGAELADEL